MIELVQMITRDYEKRQLSTITPGLEFPEIHEKERMSVGTDVGSNFTFQLDYSGSGRFECCMARDKSGIDDKNGCAC